MNLFNIKSEYARIMGIIEENEGEVDDNIQDLLTEITENKEDLLDDLLGQVHLERYNQHVLKAEFERLKSFAESSLERETRIKKAVIDILQFFDMRSATKGSKGFAFKSATNNCFTSNRESLKVDEFRIVEEFAPITGKKSKLIEYLVTRKVDTDTLTKINDTGLFPISAYSVNINKTAIINYIKDKRKGVALDFVEGTNEIKVDPIEEFVEIVTNTSLTVK